MEKKLVRKPERLYDLLKMDEIIPEECQGCKWLNEKEKCCEYEGDKYDYFMDSEFCYEVD